MFIYKIQNKVNNKVYIGSTNNFKSRISTHKRELKNNKHHSKKLQNSYNFYGVRGFVFEVLEDLTGVVTREELYDVELKYIEKYNSNKEGYNCTDWTNPRGRFLPTNKALQAIAKDKKSFYFYKEKLEDILNTYTNKIPDLELPLLFNGFRLESKSTPLKRIYSSLNILEEVLQELSALTGKEDYIKVSHINYLSGSYDYNISCGGCKLNAKGKPVNWSVPDKEDKIHFCDHLINAWKNELLDSKNGQAFYQILLEEGLEEWWTNDQ